VCGRASDELTVNSTARKAGEETLRGDSAGPGHSVKVAGTRALVDPPVGAAPPVGRVCVRALAVELVEKLALAVVALVEVGLLVLEVDVVDELGASAEDVLVEPDPLDPPHPESSRRTGRRAKKGTWRLTF
jgi:hypothetical protein